MEIIPGIPSIGKYRLKSTLWRKMKESQHLSQLVLLILVFTPVAALFVLEIWDRLGGPNTSSELLKSDQTFSLIALLLAFSAAVNGLFYYIIRGDLIQMTTKLSEYERDASRAETWTTIGYMLGELHVLVKEIEKLEGSSHQKSELPKPVKYLENVIAHNRKALRIARKLPDDSAYAYIEIMIKNNLAYYLAELQKERSVKSSSDIDEADRDEAMLYQKELWKLVITPPDIRDPEDLLSFRERWIDTCLWVRYCFGDEKEKIKVRKTLLSLRKHFRSEKRVRELKAKYGILDNERIGH